MSGYRKGDARDALEDPERREGLFDWARRLFAASLDAVPDGEAYRLDMLRAEHDAARTLPAGDPVKLRRGEEYRSELMRQLMRYSVPVCFGERGELRGAYSWREVAAALGCDASGPAFGAATVLADLASAEVPRVRGDAPEEGGGAFDLLEPGTWGSPGVVLAMLRPYPDPDGWAAWMQVAWSAALCDELMRLA